MTNRSDAPDRRAVFTGFDPFGPHASNPSQAAAAGAAAAWPGPSEIHILPVTWDGCLASVDRLAALHPSLVVSFGLAADRQRVCIEAVAYNECGGARDNLGVRRDGELEPGGPATRSPQPDRCGQLAIESSAWSPVPVGVSGDAGRYICNATFYAALGHAGLAEATVLFVHIPAVDDATARAIGAAVARALVGRGAR